MDRKRAILSLLFASCIIIAGCGDETLNPIIEDITGEVNASESAQKVCDVGSVCLEISAKRIKAAHGGKKDSKNSTIKVPATSSDPGDDDVGTLP